MEVLRGISGGSERNQWRFRGEVNAYEEIENAVCALLTLFFYLFSSRTVIRCCFEILC